MIDAVYAMLEAARPEKFPDVEKIYIDTFGNTTQKIFICLEAEKENIVGGNDTWQCISQTIYISVIFLLQKKKLEEARHLVRELSSQVISALYSNPRLDDFLVENGAVIENDPADTLTDNRDLAAVQVITFTGKFFRRNQ